MLRSTSPTVVDQVVATELVFTPWDYPVFALLTIVQGAVIVSLCSYWFTLANWSRSSIPYAILTLAFLGNMGMYVARWLMLPFMRRPVPMPPQPGLRVGVATTFVPGAESRDMLRETVRALIAMDYPHETWVLDEGEDAAVKELCRGLGAEHFSRKHRPGYHTAAGTFQSRSKHGNYNAWLYELGFDRYDIIVSFDPDHIPKREFLTEVLGYFADPGVGYVQAAQAYYNQEASFIARGAAEETYAYYSSIQMSSYALGYPIVTGCHTAQRVLALKDVGGFAAHEADDLLITTHYRAHGWRGVYVPKILARGLTPVDWGGYLNQQRRWARSVIDVKFRLYPTLVRRLPRAERVLSFFHGLYYFQGFTIAAQIALLAAMLATDSAPGIFSFRTVPRLALLIVALQFCEFFRQRFFLDPAREWGLHWRAGILRAAKWPYILLAIGDAMKRYRGPYTITRKVKTRPKSMLAVPNLIVVILLCAGLAVGVHEHGISNLPLVLISALIVLESLVIMATELIRFPDPYDPDVRSSGRDRT